ncbi:MAG: DUF5906 domain-containing protein, partial [Planctomycetes bacterium]|nr:DUF5906 domain-containing protein [Planctomycetota bacterium]
PPTIGDHGSEDAAIVLAGDAALCSYPSAGDTLSDRSSHCNTATDPSIDHTDLGNSRRLVRRHGPRLRYCHNLHGWFLFNGKVWEQDTQHRIQELAKDTVFSIHSELVGTGDPKAQASLTKWAKASQSSGRIAAMLRLAQSEVPVAPEQLDCEPFLLAVQNGILDLRTGDLLPHDPKHLITKLSPAAYHPDALCPLYDQFISQLMRGNVELIEYLDRLCGWFLTGDISHQILPIFFGQGCNGKSTLVDLMLYVMGDHACIAPESLLSSGSRDEHPTQLADLQGRRLVVASETEHGCPLRTAQLKRLTGDGRIKARKMRGDHYEFQRTHKMVLVTNNRPPMEENTHAIWRRLKLVPFNANISNPDLEMLAKLKGEADGVLTRWALACRRWHTDAKNMREPTSVTQATEAYRQEEVSQPLHDRDLPRPPRQGGWMRNLPADRPIARSPLFSWLVTAWSWIWNTAQRWS